MSDSQQGDTEQPLCLLEELPVGSSKGFSTDSTAYYADILVVRTPTVCLPIATVVHIPEPLWNGSPINSWILPGL